MSLFLNLHLIQEKGSTKDGDDVNQQAYTDNDLNGFTSIDLRKSQSKG